MDKKKNERIKNVFYINLLSYSYYIKKYILKEEEEEEEEEDKWITKFPLSPSPSLIFSPIRGEKEMENPKKKHLNSTIFSHPKSFQFSFLHFPFPQISSTKHTIKAGNV